jgi:hypothetical protein
MPLRLRAVLAQATSATLTCRQFPVPPETLKKETIMKDGTQDVPPELTLAERRKRLADALGFLLARAWLRSVQDASQADGPPRSRGPRPPSQTSTPP